MAVSIVPLRGGPNSPPFSSARLEAIWEQLVAEGKVEDVFYSGGVASPAEFLRFVANPASSILVGIEAESTAIRGLAWLTNVHDGSAFLHYCTLGGFRRAVARALLAHLESLRQADGRPALDRLLGITPEVNAAALRMLKVMGFTTLGTIPGYCRLASRGGRCGGVISYYELRPGSSVLSAAARCGPATLSPP